VLARIVLTGLGVAVVGFWGWVWLLTRPNPIFESIRDYERQQSAQGWTDAPRWRFQAEIDAMQQKEQV
jgi:hypothetical protein